MCILGADTGVGKSSFARAMAYGAARSGLGDVYVVNLEDGNDNLADRVIGEHTGLGGSRVRKAEFAGSDYERIKTVGEDGVLERIVVDDSTYEATEIAKNIRDYATRRPLALTVIDYVQLLGVKDAPSDNVRIVRAMRILQWLAKETRAPVLALSQVTTKKLMDRGMDYFHRAKLAGESGDDLYEGFAPQRGDLAWASELDQYAKMVMVAFRPGPYRRTAEDDVDKDTRVQLRLIKNNFGPCKRFTLGWDAPLSRVYDLAN